MKKKLAVLLVAACMVVLSACGANSTGGSSSSSTSSSGSSNAKRPSGRTLIVYFSPANSDTSDAVTSATPRINNVSSVEYFARQIAKRVDARTAKIVPTKAYPTNYDATADQAKDEHDNNSRPGFRLNVNPEKYDTIFVGYPMWWGDMPMVMDTFFDRYNLSGKIIIPFNTHAGSGDGGTYDDIKKLEPKAHVRDGLAIEGQGVKDQRNSINDWLNKLGYK